MKLKIGLLLPATILALSVAVHGHHSFAATYRQDQTVTIEGVKLADFSGRSLMIHEGGDNYSDQPENGGGKSRIACGVIPE